MPVYKIREETVSVLLSEILEEAGVTNVSLLNIGGKPDNPKNPLPESCEDEPYDYKKIIRTCHTSLR